MIFRLILVRIALKSSNIDWLDEFERLKLNVSYWLNEQMIKVCYNLLSLIYHLCKIKNTYWL